MNTIIFIPARGGSKSIKDKNIKELGGKPLICYSIESAFKAGIDRVIVNTDSKEIADIAQGYGAEIMMRPSNLGGDNTSMFEVLKNEIPKINPKPDLVLLLQPTSPFRSSLHIKLAMNMLSKNIDKYDSIIGVERVPDKYNPGDVIIETPTGKSMVMGKLLTLKEKIKSKFTGVTHTLPTLSGVPISKRLTRRQDHPTAWIPTGAIYLFKAENLKGGSLYGERTMLLESEGTININSPDDWQIAEQWLQK